jgi:hypothetical protein
VKSKLYEILSQDSSLIADDTKFLVNFEQKTSDKCNKIAETGTAKEPEEEKEEVDHFSDEYDDSLDPEEDWYAVGYRLTFEIYSNQITVQFLPHRR